MAFLAALHYWFPKMFGRMYPERWGLVGAVLVILGFNFTFIPQFLLGNEGMPRRYYSYPERFWPLNVASTAGASVLAARARPHPRLPARRAPVRPGAPGRTRGGRAGTSGTSPTPPPPENFEETPVFTRGPHEYDDAVEAPPPPVRRADPCQLKRTRTSRTTSRASRSRQHAARLGMWLFLATEVLLFTALFAAYAVYRFLFHADFAEASRHIETWIGVVNTVVLVTSSFTVALGLDRATRGDGRGTAIFFGLSVLLALTFLGFKAIEYTHHFQEGQLPGRFYTYEGVRGPGAAMFFALYFLITGLHGVHVVIGMTVLIVVGIRRRARQLRRRVPHARRARGALLAPRRPHLDLRLPAHLPDLTEATPMADPHAPAHDPTGGHAHSHVARYAIVWVALLFFTFLTYGLSRLHIPGGWGVVVALGIASVKGAPRRALLHAPVGPARREPARVPHLARVRLAAHRPRPPRQRDPLPAREPARLGRRAAGRGRGRAAADELRAAAVAATSSWA